MIINAVSSQIYSKKHFLNQYFSLFKVKTLKFNFHMLFVIIYLNILMHKSSVFRINVVLN